jgi:hypothetical protein
MCIYTCDKGACMHPYFSNNCASMCNCGKNMHARVCTYGENNRAPEAKLRGVKKTCLFEILVFYGL